MSAGPLLAFAAAVAGVLAAWEWLGAIERSRLVAAIARLIEPVARAGREGREPSRSERVRLALTATGALFTAGWLLGGPGIGVVAAICGPSAVVAVVRARRRRFARDLRRAAAEVARALADAIGAGHSIRGAMRAAATAVPGAAGHELRLATAALAVGEPMDAVLERLRVRARSRPWDALVAGILLQRDAGGDLAGLLRELAGSLDAAARAERDALAATAQARFTARLVLMLPVGAAVLAELGSPGLLASRLAGPLPAALIGVAACLQLTAMAAIHALTRAPGRGARRQ